jgi:hypothetical protein
VDLTENIARRFAGVALGHVARAFPCKDDHVFTGPEDLRLPQVAHPVFFGSFDWHSCVHGWWTLLTLRRLYPAMPEAADIAQLADATFTPEKLAVELAYLARPSARGFERPYGWGWLLYLHHEATRHDDRAWGERLEPLAHAIAKRFHDYLGILTYPITVGTHFNTAFALVLARRWASDRDARLVMRIDDWATRAFAHRRDYAGWEPGGDEFLSPVLTAALLMAEVRPRPAFAPWFEALVVDNGWLTRECRPVTVSDRSDGKVVHLDGLNLSRAWCLCAIARALGRTAPEDALQSLARQHLAAALPHVEGDYMGEHWLASFALLALLPEGS